MKTIASSNERLRKFEFILALRAQSGENSKPPDFRLYRVESDMPFRCSDLLRPPLVTSNAPSQ